MAQQKQTFVDGINSDTVDELMPQGMDRYRLNVRVLSSENGTVGAIETVNGNTLVTNVNLPAGTNTVIGSKEDIIRRRIYYFVHNSNGNHSIFEYDILANTIAIVLQEGVGATKVDGLNFSTSYLITSINFIELDADNHLMYWTDGYNAPRKLNIEKAKYFSAGNHTLGYKTPFDITWINRIKIPPDRPSYSWSNNASIVYNSLLNKNFQFKLQYVYDDGEVSAWSKFSIYRYPEVTYYNNNCNDDYTQDNQIDIDFNSGSSIVKKIRIAAKETNQTDFFLIDEIDKEEFGYSDNTQYTYTFINDGVYLPIEVNESIKLYDNVPQISQTHDIIAGNRLVDGNITEGYDNTPVDFVLSLDFQSVDNSTPNPKDITDASYLKSGGEYTYGIVYYDFANRSGTANLNKGLYTDLLPNGKYGSTLKIPFLTETAYTLKQLNSAPEVRYDIYNEAPSWATHYQFVRTKNKAVRKYYQMAAQWVAYYAGGAIVDPRVTVATSMAVNIGNILDGGAYKVGYPHSKLTYDFTEGDRIRFIANPPYVSVAYPAPVPPVAPPPVYGLSYILPSGGGSSSTYGALPDSVNLPYLDYEIIGYDSTTEAISIKLPTGAVIPNSELILPGCIYEIYTPEKTVDEENQIMYEINEMQEVAEDANGRFIHYGQANQQVIVDSTSGSYAAFILTLNVPIGHGLVNGNRVKVVESSTSYGYGTITATTPTTITINTTGVWTGGAIVGASTVYKSAFGIFQSGDSFRPYQDMPYSIDITSNSGYPETTILSVYSHVENMNVNNFFDSEQWDYQRPNKYDPNNKRINRKSTVVYSESFIPETNINGLSSVFDTNFETYQDKFGGIYKLYAENQTLLMFQELKIAQIPVQQVIYNDLQGGNTVGASPTILSPQPIYYAGEYGIGKNPESFAVYGTAKYGIDLYRGVVWRLSIDGLTPISDTGFMHNYFTDKCAAIVLNATNKVNVFGGYDTKFSEYIISFSAYTDKNSNRIDGETIAFNEQANKWSTFYSYVPETISTSGINIVTFKNGNLYKHNTNSLQANFYGVQGVADIWSIVNIEPSKVKILEAISEETNDAWAVTSITTPNGQLSNLVVADFEEKENNQYAFVWRDQNTPNLVAGTALFEGDPMRDRTFLCKFRYTPTTYNKLYALNFYVIPSERSNK